MEKVASILARHFKKWGVTHVFGIPGKAVVPLLLEIDDNEVEFVLSKHEGAAGYEAAGFALQSNNIGVAIGTSGPGGTNLLTAAGQAKASHLPTLIITGHPSIQQVGKAMGQDSTQFGTDLAEMFKHVTKFSARVERGDQVKSYLMHALEEAYSGVKGPVHLSIPADVLTEEIEPFEMDLPETEYVISSKAGEVIDQLNHAKRPVMFLGKGVHSSKAYEEVKLISELWNIPVITTPGGKGTFISRHPLSLGAFGLGGTDEAHAYIEEGVDVMLVMGTKLSDMSLAGLSEETFPEKVIQFDYDKTFIQKALDVTTLFVSGDLKRNLQTVLGEAYKRGKEKEPKRISSSKKKLIYVEEDEEDGFMSSISAIHTLNEALPEDTIVFGDAGSHSFYAIKYLNIKQPGTFFFDDVFGAMGYAIGFSVGAKLATPDRNVVCLTGDGCMLMQGTEISTAVNSNSAVIFVVLNNNGLDMVDKGMRAHVGKSVGTTLSKAVNICQYAQSMGALTFKCKTSEELAEAIQLSMKSNITSVIEVVVDPNETPPTMRRG